MVHSTGAKKHVIFSSSGTGKVSPFVKDALARMQHPTSYAQPFDIDMSYVISTIRLASYNLTVKRRRYSPLTAREVKRIPISWAMMSTLLGCPLSFCLKYVFRRDHAVKGSAVRHRRHHHHHVVPMRLLITDRSIAQTLAWYSCMDEYCIVQLKSMHKLR